MSLPAAHHYLHRLIILILICRETVVGGHDIMSLDNWNETFYYYHLVDDAFKIIKSKDTVSTDVIPEVRRI